MRIRCPHCQVAIDVVHEIPDSDVTCPSCGSRIDRALASTLKLSPEEMAKLAVQPDTSEVLAADQATTQAPETPKKQMFGRFELQSLLGQGTFGTVWKALDTEDQRLVALKLLRSQTEIQPGQEAEARDARTRFEREARTLAKLEHPGIVRLYKFGAIDDRLYLASELIDGNNLKVLFKWLREKEEWYTFKQVAQLCGQVAEALRAAHAAGIVHRDLKPANILLDSQGSPHVADFGLAKRDDRAEYTMTQAQELLGTPVYMAPEQWENPHLVGPASDIYSLGAMLYEFLTGRVPFLGTTLEKLPLLREQVVRDDPIAPRKLRSDIPVDLETICLKCLEKDPAGRFASAQQLADELRRFVGGDPIEARPPTRIQLTRRWCQRNPIIASLSAAIALSLLIGTIVSTYFAVLESRTAKNERIAREATEATLARSNFFLAVSRGEQGQLAEAFDALDHIPEQHRYCEWYYLRQQLVGSDVTLYGHANGATCVAYSPDGQRLVSGSADNTIKLWNATTGKELRTLTGHAQRVTSVSFSPDGQRVASASLDHTVKLWELESGEELCTLTGHTSGVSCVSISPDGKQIASAGGENIKEYSKPNVFIRMSENVFVPTSVNDLTPAKEIDNVVKRWDIKLWDARTGAELHTLSSHAKPVTSVSFSPDGKWLASGSEDSTIKLWDSRNGAELRTLSGHESVVQSLSFSPDGHRIASASFDGTIKLWDTHSGMELGTLTGHTQAVTSVSFSPDGQRLASSAGTDLSQPFELKLWHAPSGKEIRTFSGHTQPVSSLSFSPDGQQLASASADSTIKLWDVRSGDHSRTLSRHTGLVGSVVFSPDAQLLAVSSGRTVILLNVHNGTEPQTLIGHTDDVTDFCFSPDGQWIASSSADGTIKLWDARNGTELKTLIGHTRLVGSVSFCPDSLRLVSASMDRTIKLWNANTGKELRTLVELPSLAPHTPTHTIARVSPDGQRIASASRVFQFGREITFWDIRNGEKLATLPGHIRAVLCLSFSPDGTRLASGSEDSTIKLWDSQSGAELNTLMGHTEQVLSLSFSSNGQLLASASSDGTIKLWDVPSGGELRTIAMDVKMLSLAKTSVVAVPNSPDLQNYVRLSPVKTLVVAVGLSSDGKRLAAASADQSEINQSDVKLWDTRGVGYRTLIGHPKQVTHLSFSNDGERLFSGDEQDTRIAWSVTSGKIVPVPLDDFPIFKPEVSYAASPSNRAIDGDQIIENPSNSGTVSDLGVPKFPSTTDRGNCRSPDGRWLAFPDGRRIRLVDLSPPLKDELLYREAKAKLDPWWQAEQAEMAEAGQVWYSAIFHRTWLVKAKPDDSKAWTQLQTAAAKTVAENQPLPPITIQLYRDRNEPLPTKKVE